MTSVFIIISNMKLCMLFKSFCRNLSRGLKSAWINQRLITGLLVLIIASDLFITRGHCNPLRHKRHVSKPHVIKGLIRITGQVLDRIEDLKDLYFEHHRFSRTIKSKLEEMEDERFPIANYPSNEETDIDPLQLFMMECDFQELKKLMNVSRKTELDLYGPSNKQGSFAPNFRKIMDGHVEGRRTNNNHSIQHILHELSLLGRTKGKCDFTVPDIKHEHVLETNRLNYLYLNHAQRYVSATRTYMCSLYNNLKTTGVHNDVDCQ